MASEKSNTREHKKDNERSQSRSQHKDEARDQKQSDSKSEKSGSKDNKSSRSASKGESRLEPGKSGRTTDHEVIRRWIEERGGRPATVRATEGKSDPGLLRVDFPSRSSRGRDENTLEEISWDEFFDKFEEKKLAFLYQEQTRTGRESRFSKFVNRGKEDGGNSSGGSSGGKKNDQKSDQKGSRK